MRTTTRAEEEKDALVTAVGVFPGYPEAIEAISAMRRAGIRDDQIGVIGPEGAAAAHGHSGLAHDPTRTRWEEGTGVGAALGSLAGLGLGTAVAAGLMSPLGPVVAGGALVAVIASAGTGAAIGTVIGGLAGLGVPEEDAKWYADALEAGKVVVTVRAADGSTAREIIRNYGGSRGPV